MTQDPKQGVFYAVLAGSFAALGSVSAKLAFSSDVVYQHCSHLLQYVSNDAEITCPQGTIYLQGVFFLGIFLCNTLMWTLFTKSLQYFPSSAQATVTNMATNFLVSALFGWSLFSEKLTLKWWFGSSLMLAGLIFMHRGSKHSEDQQKEKLG